MPKPEPRCSPRRRDCRTAAPPDASHVPAPPRIARQGLNHPVGSQSTSREEHIPEGSGRRQVTNSLFQASQAGIFWEFSSPACPHHPANTLGDLALTLHSFKLLFLHCFNALGEATRAWQSSAPGSTARSAETEPAPRRKTLAPTSGVPDTRADRWRKPRRRPAGMTK